MTLTETLLIPTLSLTFCHCAFFSKTSVVQFFPDVNVGSLYPNVAKYMERCASREAYAQAFTPRVQQFVLQNLQEEPPKKVFGVF